MSDRDLELLLENQAVIMETLVTLLNRTRPKNTNNPRAILEQIVHTRDHLLSLRAGHRG